MIGGYDMPRQSIFDMKLSKIYPLLLRKVEKKGRNREELDSVISWLTGYSSDQIEAAMDQTYGDFFQNAPEINPRAVHISGKICGVRVEDIEDPLMQKIRWLDKLVDELAKGKPLEKILR